MTDKFARCRARIKRRGRGAFDYLRENAAGNFGND